MSSMVKQAGNFWVPNPDRVTKKYRKYERKSKDIRTRGVYSVESWGVDVVDYWMDL